MTCSGRDSVIIDADMCLNSNLIQFPFFKYSFIHFFLNFKSRERERLSHTSSLAKMGSTRNYLVLQKLPYLPQVLDLIHEKNIMAFTAMLILHQMLRANLEQGPEATVKSRTSMLYQLFSSDFWTT